MNNLFAFVYYNARPMEQEQVLNKAYVIMWWFVAGSLAGSIVVVFVNQEMKVVMGEVKNGMYNIHCLQCLFLSY